MTDETTHALTAPASPSTPASLIWFTDRSRFKTGTSRCPRARYLGYHFGPSGYGITTISESMPLATGRFLAAGVEALFKILQATGEPPDLTATRQTIALIQETYFAELSAKGFRGGVLASTQTDELATEQSTLLAGLLWTCRLQFMPWFHANYEVVEIEQERLHLLDCTCGVGGANLDQTAHDAAGCQGIALMIRCDLLARHRQSGNLAYFEVKSTGWESSAWAEQWETDYQLALGTLDMVGRYGVEVTELFIVGFNKGSRKREKDEFGVESGIKRQQSALCYAYCRPSNPPFAQDDWVPSYRYQGEDGKLKTVSRQHKKRPIWELRDSDWSVLQAYREQDPEATAEEIWFRLLPEEVAQKICFVLGPMNRQDAQLESVCRAMAAEENRWRDRLWQIYDRSLTASFGDPSMQAALDTWMPQSWACRPFGKEHECEFVPICHRHSGWQDPLSMGKYRLRLPHHQPEKDQAIARGLLVDDAVVVEEGE